MLSVLNFLSYNKVPHEVIKQDNWTTVIKTSAVKIVTTMAIDQRRTIGDSLVSKNFINGKYVSDDLLIDELIDVLNLEA